MLSSFFIILRILVLLFPRGVLFFCAQTNMSPNVPSQLRSARPITLTARLRQSDQRWLLTPQPGIWRSPERLRSAIGLLCAVLSQAHALLDPALFSLVRFSFLYFFFLTILNLSLLFSLFTNRFNFPFLVFLSNSFAVKYHNIFEYTFPLWAALCCKYFRKAYFFWPLCLIRLSFLCFYFSCFLSCYSSRCLSSYFFLAQGQISFLRAWINIAHNVPPTCADLCLPQAPSSSYQCTNWHTRRVVCCMETTYYSYLRRRFFSSTMALFFSGAHEVRTKNLPH